MKKFLLLISLFTFSIYMFNACSSNSTPGESFEIRIGVLVGLTGSHSSRGEEITAGLEIAEKEINTFLEQNKYSFRIKLLIEDTQTDTNICYQKIQELSTKGVRYIIGPITSAEVKKVLSYANQYNLILISPSAVAPSLSIANDNFFRLVPSDSLQAQAILKMLTYKNIRALIPLIRDDVWANELCNIVSSKFQSAGYFIPQTIKYDPNNTNLAPTINQLNETVISLKNMGYSENQIAVYLLSYNEGTNYLLEAINFPTLHNVNWFGGSAFTMNSTLISNEQASQFAQSVNFLAPIYGFDDNYKNKWEPVVNKIELKIGRKPSITAINAIDILWLITQTYISAGILTDFQTMKLLFISLANSYNGLNGFTTLNQYGDRKEANYDFWGIEKIENKFAWVRKAIYITSSDELNFIK